MQKITYLLFIQTFQYLLVFGQIQIIDNFENANVEIISISNTSQTITFKPSLKLDNQTTRCWYYFGVTGYNKQDTLTFVAINKKIMNASFPVFRSNQTQWQHTTAKTIDDTTKSFNIQVNSDTVFVAAGFPYTYSDMLGYIDSIAKSTKIDTQTIYKTPLNLKVVLLKIYNPYYKAQNCIWIIGRQHAFESTLNFTLEGFINFFLNENDTINEFFKKNLIFVVPMVDVDNVFLGASGRMQRPIDYNRDWNKNPQTPIIKKLIQLIDSTRHKYNYTIFIDFHSTFPGTNSPTFAFMNDFDKNSIFSKNIKKFNEIFEKQSGYKLLELQSNQKGDYADTFNAELLSLKKNKINFATTLECDWYYNHDKNVLTKDNLRKIGYYLAKSICIYTK